jgi:hypothetical protein
VLVERRSLTGRAEENLERTVGTSPIQMYGVTATSDTRYSAVPLELAVSATRPDARLASLRS